MDDLLDVVDEEDKVVGQELYTKIHEEELIHRTSAIFVFKDPSFSEMLITMRSENVSAPKKLDVPGGHVLASQSYLECARQELQEEVFHKRPLPQSLVLQELFKTLSEEGLCKGFVSVFSTIYPGPFEKNREEVDYAFFMSVDKLKKDVREKPEKYTETFRAIFKKYWEDFE